MTRVGVFPCASLASSARSAGVQTLPVLLIVLGLSPAFDPAEGVGLLCPNSVDADPDCLRYLDECARFITIKPKPKTQDAPLHRSHESELPSQPLVAIVLHTCPLYTLPGGLRQEESAVRCPVSLRSEYAMGFEPETPEEFELKWLAEHPEGEIIHTEHDEEGKLVIDDDPYGEEDDDD
jgi:hypothetical protein